MVINFVENAGMKKREKKTYKLAKHAKFNIVIEGESIIAQINAGLWET